MAGVVAQAQEIGVGGLARPGFDQGAHGARGQGRVKRRQRRGDGRRQDAQRVPAGRQAAQRAARGGDQRPLQHQFAAQFGRLFGGDGILREGGRKESGTQRRKGGAGGKNGLDHEKPLCCGRAARGR